MPHTHTHTQHCHHGLLLTGWGCQVVRYNQIN